MKYAKLVKLGGELIEAKDADYQDYYGILTCPECGEPVFLRKGFMRGDTPVGPVFVHHKAIPEMSACDLRVGKYSQEYVARVAGEARNQRLRILQRYLWKFILTSVAYSRIDGWQKAIKEIKKVYGYKAMIGFGESVLAQKKELILSGISRASITSLRDPQVYSGKKIPRIEKFLEQREKDWTFHLKIAKEALSLFLAAPQFLYIRKRVIGLSFYTALQDDVSLLSQLRIGTDEWFKHLAIHFFNSIVTIFVMIDWVELLKSNTEMLSAEKDERRRPRGFAR